MPFCLPNSAAAYAPRETAATTTLTGGELIQRRAWRLDAHGRLAEVDEYDDPAGSAATTSYLYDPFGQLAQVKDAA